MRERPPGRGGRAAATRALLSWPTGGRRPPHPVFGRPNSLCTWHTGRLRRCRHRSGYGPGCRRQSSDPKHGRFALDLVVSLLDLGFALLDLAVALLDLAVALLDLAVALLHLAVSLLDLAVALLALAVALLDLAGFLLDLAVSLLDLCLCGLDLADVVGGFALVAKPLSPRWLPQGASACCF